MRVAEEALGSELQLGVGVPCSGFLGVFVHTPPSFSAGRQPPAGSVARSHIHRWPPAALDLCPCSPWGGLGAGSGTRAGSRRVLAPLA